jgi:membrane associated rhomboid family serine protease
MDDIGEVESRWELQPQGCFVAIVPGGLRLGLKRRGLDTTFVPFEDLTHVEVTGFGVWLATTKTTRLIRRSHFVQERDPEDLVQAVRWRLAEEPGGVEQIARMRGVAELALAPHPRRTTYALIALCLGAFALEFIDPFVLQAGVFVPGLVSLGEWWRVATANLLHGFSLLPLHLIINMLCLAAFGLLVERPLGATRVFLVMGAGGAAAMLGSAIAGYHEVLGASGVVAGLVGAVLWLELNEPARLPAWWRIPRRLFIGVLILQALLDMMLPFIAAAAHLGGFLGGYLVMPFAVRGSLEGAAPNREQRYAGAALAVLLIASVVSAGQLVRRDARTLASHGRHLLAMSSVGARGLNDLAWRMVTESEPEPEGLLVATQLAQRAVDKTGRRDPNVLDTLAEVLFIAGDDRGAVSVIDEAIVLAGHEVVYFREQRRRFIGERAADDRPAPPDHYIVPQPESDDVFPQDPGFEI